MEEIKRWIYIVEYYSATKKERFHSLLRKRGKPGSTLLTIENQLKISGGEVGQGGWIKWTMDIKENICNEH